MLGRPIPSPVGARAEDGGLPPPAGPPFRLRSKRPNRAASPCPGGGIAAALEIVGKLLTGNRTMQTKPYTPDQSAPEVGIV